MSIFSTLFKATFVHEGENSLFSFQQKTCQVFTLKDSYCYFLFRMALKRRIDFLLEVDPSQKKQLNMIHPVKNVWLVGKGGFFSESAMCFSNLQISKKLFWKTILDFKFKFPPNFSILLLAGNLNFKFRIVFWNILFGGLKESCL